MEKSSKIYIAGSSGLVGSAILRKLESLGYSNIITSDSVDLRNQAETEKFFEENKPEYVFLAAAKVGGILANIEYPAEFIYDNIMIATNVIHSSYKFGVKKLLNLGSTCIYPVDAEQPYKEDSIFSARLEKSNEAYAIAKSAAIKMCKFYNEQYKTNFISLMPSNQYGYNDHFNFETGHILPVIMRKFHLAKMLFYKNFDEIAVDLKRNEIGFGYDKIIDFNDINSMKFILAQLGIFEDKVIIWGDSSCRREFMFSDDLADACVYFMKNKDYSDIGDLVNITSGTDISMKELYDILEEVVGFSGSIEYDKSKPIGIHSKLVSDEKVKALGWQPKINLKEGVEKLYNWYLGYDE